MTPSPPPPPASPVRVFDFYPMRIHLDREGTKRIKVLGGSNGELVSERLRELVSERLRSRALLKSNTGRIAAGIEAAGTGAIHSTITDNIVRVGLNYQFH